MAKHVLYPETPKLLEAITEAKKFTRSSSVLNYIGTVKLHGANTAIGYQKDIGHWYQSRNRLITPNDDHAGFAQTMNDFTADFFITYVVPHCPTIREHYNLGDRIIIYGEWCGGNIQENVAITGLPTMFVIFKVKIICESKKTKKSTIEDTEQSQMQHSGSYWLDPKEWTVIKWHERFIYNIFDFPTFTIDIDFQNPELVQETLSKITEEVERQCPVGAYFNRIGIGEGVVWTEWTISRGTLTFKVKGRQHMVVQSKILVPVTPVKFTNIDDFVQYACTINRMSQALDYMREQHIPIEVKSLDIFLRWLTEDICKEEKECMNISNISAKEVSRAITKKAETWFMNTITVIRKTHSKQKRKGNK